MKNSAISKISAKKANKTFSAEVFSYRERAVPKIIRLFAMETGQKMSDLPKWQTYYLSNGGFFMAPSMPADTRLRVRLESIDEHLTPEAFGILCSLFAYSYMAGEAEDTLDMVNAKRANNLISKLYDYADCNCADVLEILDFALATIDPAHWLEPEIS